MEQCAIHQAARLVSPTGPHTHPHSLPWLFLITFLFQMSHFVGCVSSWPPNNHLVASVSSEPYSGPNKAGKPVPWRVCV